MPDIFHDFPIFAPAQAVFDGVSTPTGLDKWWTDRSSGTPKRGNEYGLSFGPKFDWAARVTECVAREKFELEITKADADWKGTKIGFALSPIAGGTQVRFHHKGWPHLNEHYRVSCYCWAMYLRILKRSIEYGETVPYAKRLEA